MLPRISAAVPSRLILIVCLCAAAVACLPSSGVSAARPGAQPGRTEDALRSRSSARAVQDTTQYPWSCICKIVATFPDDTTIEGAGTMIGPHHCLTALHVIYDSRTRTAAKRVRVIPGYDDHRLLTEGLSSHPFGTAHMNQFLFWEPHDVAIIITSANIGELSSWMTVGSRSDRELQAHGYLLGGYSGRNAGSERQNTLTTSIGRVEGDRVALNGETGAGANGGPIFERTARGGPGEQDVWSIVGIQTSASRGTRIPPDMRRILERFLRDDFTGVNAKIPVPER
jgi:V8-like Glu-specific endopeptidase